MASYGQAPLGTHAPGALPAYNPQPGSEIEALAKMPAGAITSETAATSFMPGPPCAVKTETAIGEARVDTAFLQQAHPNLDTLASTVDRLNAATAEKASAEAAAAAILQQAAAKMAEAAAKQKEIDLARAASEAALAAQRRDMVTQIEALKDAKLTEAQHAQATAEIEARFAAKAKAEEAASVEAARMAAAEAAEAEAMMKAAEMKRAQALAAQAQLMAAAADAREDAAAATKRAATLTAGAEARAREAKLADAHLAKTEAVLGRVEADMAALTTAEGGSGKPGVSTVTTVGAGGLKTTATASTERMPTEVCAVEGVKEWYPMAVFFPGAAAPSMSDFGHELHVRITHADFPALSGGGALPKRVWLQVRSGGLEAWTDRILDTAVGTRWNVEGFLPIRDVSAPVEFILVDASEYTAPGYKPSAPLRELGRAHLRIHTLTDGHLSRNNAMKLDGIGATLYTNLHLSKWGASGCEPAASASSSSFASGSAKPAASRWNWSEWDSAKGTAAGGFAYPFFGPATTASAAPLPSAGGTGGSGFSGLASYGTGQKHWRLMRA